jgi:CrcB protein
MEVLFISIGGALGAVLRYAVGQALGDSSSPWATLVVNATGSFVLGVVLFDVTSPDVLLLVTVGFCGAFTTFSSFSFQTIGLWERDEHARAVVNAVGNLLVSLLAFASAWLVVS